MLVRHERFIRYLLASIFVGLSYDSYIQAYQDGGIEGTSNKAEG